MAKQGEQHQNELKRFVVLATTNRIELTAVMKELLEQTSSFPAALNVNSFI